MDNNLNQAVFAAMVAMVGVLVTLIRVVGPVIDQIVELWVRKQLVQLDNRLPESWRGALREAAIFGAQAAEQAGLARLITNSATCKKQYAIAAAERWLQGQGYTIDLHTLGDAIEQVILLGLHIPPPPSRVRGISQPVL